jgi:hypothetical protein
MAHHDGNKCGSNFIHVEKKQRVKEKPGKARLTLFITIIL